jgi:hypothetical protein
MNTEITDLASFVDRLMAEKGLDGLDEAVRAEVKNDLISRLEDRVNAALLAHMPAENAAELETVLESKDEKHIQDFIAASIPNSKEVVAEALMSFRQTYLNA